jgi:NAD(P)H-dependent FMN reductase
MKILVICGSPRKNSLTRVLTTLAHTYARARYPEADLQYLDLGLVSVDPFRGFDESYSPATKDAIALVTSSEVLIIGSPIYNGLLSSAVKNLFEHVNYKALQGHRAGFIIHSDGTISSLQVQGQLMALMTYFRVVSNPRSVFTSQRTHFDKQGNLTDKAVEERIKELVDETIALTRG